MLNHHDSFESLYFEDPLLPFSSELEVPPSIGSIIYNQEQPEMLAPQRDRSLVTIPRIRDPSFQILYRFKKTLDYKAFQSVLDDMKEEHIWRISRL